jgi:TRAP-type C4-dicarboxylate transport system substrate-binding protein
MAVSTYGAKYAVTTVPLRFPRLRRGRQNVQRQAGKLNQEMIKNSNLRIVGLSRRGARLLTASKAIPTPTELKGLKLRVPEIKTWVDVWKEIGALPTPVAWPEVFTALQTGVVNGQENPVLQIFEGKLYEVQKFVMMTEHISSYFHWVVNEKFYQEPHPGQRKVGEDAIKSATAWGRKTGREERRACARPWKESRREVRRGG